MDAVIQQHMQSRSAYGLTVKIYRESLSFERNILIQRRRVMNNCLDGYVFEPRYLETIKKVTDRHLCSSKRLVCFRFDLHFHHDQNYNDPTVISRFIEAFKSRLKVWDSKRKSTSSIRFGFIWCREQAAGANWHYHVAFFFNMNAVSCWGKLELDRENLYCRILNAWASALNDNPHNVVGLVHTCKNGTYHLEQSNPNFSMVYSDLMKRLSYLAKVKTKQIGDGYRHFGCSQDILM